MKRIFCAMLSLIIFISAVSFVRLDVQAASWNTAPNINGYQYVNSKSQISDFRPVPGVYQGTDNVTFASKAPIATIYIAEDKVHKVAEESPKAVNMDSSDPTTLQTTHATKGVTVKIKKLWETNTEPDNALKDCLYVGDVVKQNDITSNSSIKNGWGVTGNNFLIFDQTKARSKNVNGTNIGLVIGGDNHIKGDIISYTFVDAAEYAGKSADVVITYSDLHIVLQSNIDKGDESHPVYGNQYKELDQFLICSGNDVRTNANAGTTGGQQRYGIQIDAKVQVLDKEGKEISGIFYFKAADIDVLRKENENNNTPDFTTLWKAGEYFNYSEQVQLNSGAYPTKIDNDESKTIYVYLPGGTNDTVASNNGKPKNNPPGYKATITSSSPGKYLFQPQRPETKDEQESIYTGFLAAINNKQGANVTVWSAAAHGYWGEGKWNTVSVETYLLAGNAGGTTTGVWYNLRSSTLTPDGGKGGTIETTTFGNQGSTPGALNDGGELLGPEKFSYVGADTLTVSGGRTVTYTLTPNTSEGYELKSISINDGNIDYNSTKGIKYTKKKADFEGTPSGGTATYPDMNGTTETVSWDVVKDANGEVLYYIVTFKDIQQDHSVHVEWQKKYWETYEYQLEGDPGFPLPQAVLDTLPERADIANGKENHFFTGDLIAPASPWDKLTDEPVTYVIDNDGSYDWKYTFLRYTDTDPAGGGLYSPSYNYSEYQANGEYFSTDGGGGAQKRTAMAGNIHYIGYWSKARAFRETYQYKYYEEDMVTPVSGLIPSQVTDSIPKRKGWYGDQEKVYPATPTITTYRDNNVTYRFRGWKDLTETDTYDTVNPATVNKADVDFLGIWQRITYPVYVATYEYDESGGALPDEIKNTIPYDPRDYNNGENVDAKAPSNVRMIVGKDVWVFLGWDKQSQTIPGADVKFIGKWTKAAAYTEHYAYENWDKLPPAVQNTKPTRAGRYLDGEVVSPASPSQTTVPDGDYTWRFLGWTATPADSRINGADVHFLGRWVREGGPVIIPDPTPDPAPDPGTPADPETPATPTSGGGGETPPPAAPGAEPPLPALYVPSTEFSSGNSADGGTGLTVRLGNAPPLSITPVLPEGVVPGAIQRVEVDGVVQPATVYQVDGITIVLLPELLNSLPEGTHKIRLVYENLWTDAIVTVLGATRALAMKSPPTGDPNAVLLWGLIGVQAVSATGIAVLSHRRRRFRR